MIRKGQVIAANDRRNRSLAEQFDDLASQSTRSKTIP
jgi:hypothetical protein